MDWQRQYAERRSAAVVDMSFGDAGKGSLVDWLTSPAAGAPRHGTVIRFNGGAQAAHNVIRPDGRHHTFSQFGSGSFNGWRTHLSRFMLVEPLSLSAEAEHLAALGLADPLDALSVDRYARLTTPYHAAANQAREIARGRGRHGSCGLGVGETMAYALAHPDDAPLVGDCENPVIMVRKLTRMRDFYTSVLNGRSDGAMYPGDQAAGAFFDPASVPDPAQLAAVYGQFAARVQLTAEDYLAQLMHKEWVIFEGAQGVLLDEWRGFHPYTTWSTTTYANIETLLSETGATADPLRIGLLRAYTTRHGAGPFPSEDASLTRDFPDQHNGTHRWQGIFRAGHLDLLLHRYALEVSGRTDVLALSHLDRAAQMGSRLQATNEYALSGRNLQLLRPGPFADLDYQSYLTQILQTATPVYESIEKDIPAQVERTLQLPVAITSSGPGTQHKVWRR